MLLDAVILPVNWWVSVISSPNIVDPDSSWVVMLVTEEDTIYCCAIMFPVAFILPTTVSFSSGVPVPIPTFSIPASVNKRWSFESPSTWKFTSALVGFMWNRPCPEVRVCVPLLTNLILLSSPPIPLVIKSM